ncbi:MAG: lysophospholipid acyltransferase family protein [bacterium]
MRKLLFKIFKLLVIILSILPLRILYLLADIIYILLFYIIKYRKNIVFQNLKRSFPKKSNQQITKIAKNFYRHFSDVIIEVIKMNNFSPQQLGKRINFKNPEVFEEYYQKNKQCIAVAAHYGNWEWLTGLSMHTKHACMSVYKPLDNPYFDKFFLELRQKFNVTLIPMRKTLHTMLKLTKENKLAISVFISDQSPVSTEIQHWVNFLNQDTPLYMGIEKIAKKLNIPVVFTKMKRVKRGYYEVEIIKVSDDPSKTSKFEITEKHTHILEEMILEDPSSWLWTHRKWKYTKHDVLKKKYVKK